MKIKSKLFLVFALCLVAIISVSLVACNPDGNGDNDGKNDYESATYTVTFNTNGGTSISNSVIRDVPSGSHISEPVDSDGKKSVPYKRGYTFQFWAKSSGEQFDFARDTITANTTLTASYKANVYVHTANLTEKYEYSGTENEGTDDEKDIFVKQTRTEEVVLPEVELDPKTTTLKSEYASSAAKLPVPTIKDDPQNTFCFWYYINKDGKPIQFSKWAVAGSSEVTELVSYAFVSEDPEDPYKGLVLYPMFFNDLPEVTVKYVDSANGEELRDSEPYKFGQNIENKVSTGTPATKDGYEFVEWYYEVEKTSNGETTIEKVSFVFDDGNDNTKPTSPMDAAGAENNFKPVELVLKAKWIKLITITNAEEFDSLLYGKIRDLIATIKSPVDPEKIEEAQLELDEILNASIKIQAEFGINFGNTKYYGPVFDKDHPFKGTIDGLVKRGDGNFVRTELSGGIFGDALSASVFGYNEGTIQNLNFRDIGLAIKVDDAAPTAVQMGVITTDNGGTIENCTVNVQNVFKIENLNTVTFGGITAVHHGSSKNGVIRNCNVEIYSFNADCKALTFGAIAGESLSSASIVNCEVKAFIDDVVCSGIASNGKSSLVLGGAVGVSSSAIRLCKIELTVTKAISLTEFVFGGAVGANNGSIRTTYATVTLGKEDAPVSASGSISYATCIGGLIGKNGGYVLNSYANAELFVQINDKPANASDLYIGGLVGSNYSSITDSQESSTESGICAINYSYSIGKIVVNVDSNISSVNVYVGGIAGRNSHKKVSSLFSTVGITVANEGNSYLGHIFGRMINKENGTNGKIFYDEASAITLIKDGKTYQITGDGKDAEEFIKFENVGEGTNKANFTDSKWVVGSENDSSKLGFSGTVWEVKEKEEGGEDEYPSFKPSIYDESKPATTPDGSDGSDDKNDGSDEDKDDGTDNGGSDEDND